MKLTPPPITPGPWKWSPQGNKSYVCPRHYCLNSFTGRGLASIVVKSEEEVWPKSPDAVAISSLPQVLKALEDAYEWSKALYAVLPYSAGQEALRVHADKMNQYKQALLSAGYTISES